VILDTSEYKQKITSLLEDPAYITLTRNLTDSIRQNEKLHYCLKNPLLQKICANNCVLPAPDPQDCMDFQRFIKREFL
jgi:hypothetical protein